MRDSISLMSIVIDDASCIRDKAGIEMVRAVVKSSDHRNNGNVNRRFLSAVAD